MQWWKNWVFVAVVERVLPWWLESRFWVLPKSYYDLHDSCTWYACIYIYIYTYSTRTYIYIHYIILYYIILFCMIWCYIIFLWFPMNILRGGYNVLRWSLPNGQGTSSSSWIARALLIPRRWSWWLQGDQMGTSKLQDDCYMYSYCYKLRRYDLILI